MSVVRRKTRKVIVGDRQHGFVGIGGDAPVALQTMTSTYTYDIDATVEQINALHAGGADMVRVAVPDKQDTIALKEIINQVKVPIIADVHFHFERALESIEAGVHKIRLNPGNLKDRPKVEKVIAACKERSIPIRVGANEGGIVERGNKSQRAEEMAALDNDYKGQMTAIMVEKLEEYLRIFADNDFYDVVLSAKSVDPEIVLSAYSECSRKVRFPAAPGRHPRRPAGNRPHSLGRGAGRAAGPRHRRHHPHQLRRPTPFMKSKTARNCCKCSGLRLRTEPELIACPTCGRIEIDLISMMSEVRRRLKEITMPVKVAVMGCVVNGPGECRGKRRARSSPARAKASSTSKRRPSRWPPCRRHEILDRLFEEVRNFAATVERGEAKLKNARVDIKPPDPIGELGSGWDKIKTEKLSLPVMRG